MAKIRTIEQRKRLAHRRKPYWHKIDGLRGAALGFRKHAARGLQGGGAWVLRYRVDGKYLEHAFAESDNARMPANGSSVLTFDEAINRARFLYSKRTGEFTKDEQAVIDELVRAAAEDQKSITGNAVRSTAKALGIVVDETDVGAIAKEASFKFRVDKPYTVSKCCRDYVDKLEREGKRFKDASQTLEAFVIPALGDVVLEELTAKQIRAWMHALHAKKPRTRSPMSGKVRRYRKVDPGDEDYPRRRAATVNRVWTSFRAALNHAFVEDLLLSAQFQKVKPLTVGQLKTVNRADCRPILPEEMDAFLGAVALEGTDFENLILVGLYSGCRYGELGRLRVGDYDRRHGTLFVRPGKTGYDRLVRIIPEGRTLLERLTKGRKRNDLLLTHDGEPWGKSHQSRPMSRVVARCKLDGVSFKSARDTFGTWLLNAGVRLVVVADQLGHRNVDITRKHYAKILATLETESTVLAGRIRMVGGAKIVDLDEHRKGRERDSA